MGSVALPQGSTSVEGLRASMPSAAFEPLNALLQQPLSNVVAERLNERLVVLHASSTVEEAFRVLSKNQIISAPVVKPAKDNQRLEWIGFVSYSDLIRYTWFLSLTLSWPTASLSLHQILWTVHRAR